MEGEIRADGTNSMEAEVYAEIISCLNIQSPKSFFLFAGAGSGKTRSLVDALRYLQGSSSRILRLRGQRVGVITYTNKACDEIKHRIGFDPLIEVSTIHSFVWSLIQGFNEDIKEWLRGELNTDIADLKEKQAKGRAGKASLDREKSIEAKTKRLSALSTIKKFLYNPNGDNKGRDSLNHSEVIKLTAYFLSKKLSMQQLLIKKFPILLIDESQDTNRMLMEAFLDVQRQNAGDFTLGLFGDTMQRIYADGKADLGNNLPADWATPQKRINYRCPLRVIKLLNRLRADVDSQHQIPSKNATEGMVRLFLINSNTVDKKQTEYLLMQKMVLASGDSNWNRPEEVKVLILEHHMAATRMGFLEMYEPLYRNDTLRIGLLEGNLGGLRLFTDCILPVVNAKRINDSFAIANIIRKLSPLINKALLRSSGQAQVQQIHKANDAVEQLWTLWADGVEPRFLDVLRNVAKSGLFEIPESLKPITTRNEEEQLIAESDVLRRVATDDRSSETILDSWDEFLLTPFGQLELYVKYINGEASFDTHQGVKGLEFPRVMVTIDDSSARGFLFSYDKLFGVKDKTKTDIENEIAGKETGVDRTRRLFYVTCSRAERSLAIVAYTDNPQAVKDNVILQGWFEAKEIEII